jgi:hypothetical protein
LGSVAEGAAGVYAARGSAKGQSPGVYLLAVFSEKLQGVIGQLRVAPEANNITAALERLKILPLEGITITGDAIFTQREICRVIIEGGGVYSFTVKDNQPALKAHIVSASIAPPARTPLTAPCPDRPMSQLALSDDPSALGLHLPGDATPCARSLLPWTRGGNASFQTDKLPPRPRTVPRADRPV